MNGRRIQSLVDLFFLHVNKCVLLTIGSSRLLGRLMQLVSGSHGTTFNVKSTEDVDNTPFYKFLYYKKSIMAI